MWNDIAPGSALTWAVLNASFLADQTVNTRDSYARSVREFFAFCGKAPVDVQMMDVQRWRDEIKALGRSDATVRAKIAGLSSFFRFLRRPIDAFGTRVLRENPCEDIKLAAVPMYGRSVKMSIEEFRAILAVVPNTPEGHRDRAWMLFHALTARRRSEVLRLKTSDFQRDGDATLYSYVGKGGKGKGKPREVPSDALAALSVWQAHSQPSEDCIWGNKGSGVSKSAFFVRLKRYAVAAGVNEKVARPHAFRHLAAELFRADSSDLDEVRDFLDHSSIATTAIYLKSLETKRDVTARERGRRLLG